MTSTGNWQGAVGDLLDAAALADDTVDLALLTARDANGAPLADRLPREALRRDGDDLDAWWTDTDDPQSAVWARHGWHVLRADPATMTVTFARIDGEQQGQGR